MFSDRPRCWLIVPLCCLFAPLLAAENDAGIDLLANSRFQEIRPSGAPIEWEAASDPATIAAKLTIEGGPQGSRAIRLDCQRLTDAAASGHGMLAQRGKVKLEPGRWYRLSLWARESGIPGGGVNIAIYRMRDFTNCGLNVTGRLGREWRRLSFIFQAQIDPGETGRFQIWYGESGSLWVAQPTLAPCEPPQRIYHPSLPPAPGKNLVPNGSFEAGTGCWGSTAEVTGWGSRGLNFRFGDLDPTVAFDGTCAYKIAVGPTNMPVFHFDYYQAQSTPVQAPLLANEGWIAVEPGKPYTLSAVIKADRAGVVGRMGMWTTAGGMTQAMKLSTDWKRYSVPLTPRDPRIFVALGPDLKASGMDAATIWIDCVQLEAGATATPFAPYAPIEVAFETGRLGNLFKAGEPVTIHATAANQGRVEGTATIAWRATDFFDKTVGEGRMALSLSPGRRKATAINTGMSRPGFHRLILTTESNGRASTREMRTASIVPVPAGDSHVGMNHAYPWPQLLDLCDRIGVRWMRDWSIKWQHVQPRPGALDFSEVDHQIHRVLDRNLPMLALLAFPANDWAAEVPPNLEKLPSVMLEAGRASLAPKDPERFGQLLVASMGRYGKRIKHWEILNEPLYTSYALPSGLGYKPADYVRILKAAYAAGKKADPGCVIIGGISGHPLMHMRGLIAAGGLQHMDALNLHLYPGGAAPEIYEPQLAQLRRMLRAAGRGELPIWVTECGMYADDDVPVTPAFHWNATLESERVCSEYLVRFNAILLGQGVEKIFYHAGTMGTLNLENTEGMFFEYAGAPRKMLAAQAVFCRMIPGASRILQIAGLHPEARTYLFGDATSKVMVAWVPDPGDALELRLADPRLVAIDIMGAPIAETRIPLTEAPVYITAPAEMSVEEFLASLKVAGTAARPDRGAGNAD